MFEELEALLRRDPGGRGVHAFALSGQLEPAARSLAAAKTVVICSGFPVAGPAGWVPETDGPTGALALGEALVHVGASVRYATGPRSAAVFAGLGCEPVDALDLAVGASAEARAYLTQTGATHLIAVERPSRAADERYRTMRGEELTEVSALDELFLVAAELGVKTIGIGDGGNEVGLGRVRAQVAATVPHGPAIASTVSTDWVLVAGISTWGAWTLVSALAAVCAEPALIPSPAQARSALDLLVSLGGVDGITGRLAPTLDGVGWAESAAFLEALSAAAAQRHR